MGSYFAGTLNRSNFWETALIGGLAGAASVLTAGTSALATATTLSGILNAELGAGLIGTVAGLVTDFSLTALLNAPSEIYPITKQPCGGTSNE